jgi:predicted transcriptional regulator of viral defense system
MNARSAAIIVAELAAEQQGLVTTAQARAAGASPQQVKRLADHGVLERVHHGIYRMARYPHDPHQRLRAAWIALDPGVFAWERLDQDVPTGAVSHRSAAALHGLGGIDADTMELTAARRIRLRLPDVRIHTGGLSREDWELVHDIPATTAQRTIADLAAARIDGGHLADIVRDALERGLATVPGLVRAVTPSAFDYGHRLADGEGFVRALVAEAGISQNIRDLARLAPGRGAA